MARDETRPDECDDDLSPEAAKRLWDEMQARASDQERICLNCVNMVWPARLQGDEEMIPWRVRYPVCAAHADSPGVPREVHPCGSCARFRAKPSEPVRGEPPKPERPTDKFIPLTRGLWAVVDAVDFERLNKYRWYASPSGGGKMYARRNTKTSTILMHREIMRTPRGMEVDHKDLDGLNNRQENLRNCTQEQNEYNKGPRGRKSRFKGVYPRGDKWYAMIKHKGIAYYLGTFDDEVEAAKARDRKAYELEGEYAYLNFPEEIRAEFAKRRAATTARRRGTGRRGRRAKDR